MSDAEVRAVRLEVAADFSARMLDLIAGWIEGHADDLGRGPFDPDFLRMDARDVRKVAANLRAAAGPLPCH